MQSKIKNLSVLFALASLSAALSAQAAPLTPDKGCPNTRTKGVYAPCVGILPVGATSASQAVGVHHLSNPANQHVIKGMTVQQLVANHLLPTRLPSGAATFGLAYAMDMKGGAGQQNPTSPSPSPASVGCSYGFASGPTWSGWDAVGWQYTCAAPPPPPPPVYTPPSCVCQTSPFTGVVSCANQGGYACTPGAPAAQPSAYAPPPPAPAPTGGGSSGTTPTANPPPGNIPGTTIVPPQTDYTVCSGSVGGAWGGSVSCGQNQAVWNSLQSGAGFRIGTVSGCSIWGPTVTLTYLPSAAGAANAAAQYYINLIGQC